MQYHRRFHRSWLICLICLCLPWLKSIGAAEALTEVGQVVYPTRPSTCRDSLVLYPKNFGTTDVYGYVTPGGDEFAIALALDAVVVLHLPDLAEVGRVAAPLGGTECYPHQHIARTWHRHLYVTSDGRGVNQGLMIIDLAGLESQPPSIRFVAAYAPDDAHVTNHTFDIDTVHGIAYIARQATDGFRVVDLSNPEAPRELTEMPTGSIHDMTVDPERSLLYVAEGSDSYSLYDMTNPAKPIQKAHFGLPSIRYSHNIWPTADGRYALTTDETVDSPLRVWDLDVDHNYANPKTVGTWLGGNRLAHNVRMVGDVAWVSNYSYGIVALDLRDRAHPLELAHYDTYADNDKPGYWGAFGVWVSPSSLVVTGNMDQGSLIVLQYHGPTLPLFPRVPRGEKLRNSKAGRSILRGRNRIQLNGRLLRH
jgi:choice-of-anchor B domain-containing protein